MKKLEDRRKGCLWGLIVGDCLGSPIQFTDKNNHPWITEMVPCKHFSTPAGYWTDDSAMALCIIESYIRKNGYDLSDIANNFVLWFKNGRFSSLPFAFDIGGATWSAIAGIEKGKLKNGTEDSQGNGSIMRFAPSYFIAIKHRRKSICDEISDLTHCSQAVREKAIHPFYDILSEHLAGHKTATQPSQLNREEIDNSGWSIATMNAAIWAFQTTDNFEDGMIQAVNLGGDADSIGAVYGQIAGAYYGFTAIPARWIQKIKDHEKLNDLIEKFLALTKIE